MAGLDQIVRDLLEQKASSRIVWCAVIQQPEYLKLLKASAKRTWERLSPNLRQRFDTDDIAGEVALKLCISYFTDAPFRWEPREPFEHWLSTVIANKCGDFHDYYRRRDFERSEGDLYGEQTDWARPSALLRVAITLLDEPYNSLLNMIIFNKMTQEQIAGELGYSQSWVSNRLKEATRLLREVLGK